MTGAIVLVGTPIGNLGDLSPRAVDALRTADVIAAEDTRRTRALLTHAGISAGGRLRALHAHNELAGAATLVEAAAGARASRSSPMPGCRASPIRAPPSSRRLSRRASPWRWSPDRARCSPPWCCRGCPPTASCSRGSCPDGAGGAPTVWPRWSPSPAPSCSSRPRTGCGRRSPISPPPPVPTGRSWWRGSSRRPTRRCGGARSGRGGAPRRVRAPGGVHDRPRRSRGRRRGRVGRRSRGGAAGRARGRRVGT